MQFYNVELDNTAKLGIIFIACGVGCFILYLLTRLYKRMKGIEFNSFKDTNTENVIDRLDMKVAKANTGSIKKITQNIIYTLLQGLYSGNDKIIPWNNMNNDVKQLVMSKFNADCRIGIIRELYGLQITKITIKQENKHYMQTVSTVIATVDINVNYSIRYGEKVDFEQKQFTQEFTFNIANWCLEEMGIEKNVYFQ